VSFNFCNIEPVLEKQRYMTQLNSMWRILSHGSKYK
jgi:hypothetical protein